MCRVAFIVPIKFHVERGNTARYAFKPELIIKAGVAGGHFVQYKSDTIILSGIV